MSSIKSISTIDVEPAWTTRYEVDFVKEGTASSWDARSAGNGAKRTLNGVQWEVRDVDNSSAILLDGDGFKITPTGGDLWAGTWTAPRIFARMSGTVAQVPIYPELGYGQAVAAQVIVDSSQDVAANYDSYGLSLLDNLADSVNITGRVYAGAAENRFDLYQAGGYEDQVAGSQLKFYEIVYTNGATYCNASADTKLLAPMTATTFRAGGSTLTDRGVTPSDNVIAPSEMIFFLFAFRAGSSSTTFTPTFKKFRVLTMGIDGAI